jgi:GTPase SAR1 family protein
MAATNNYGNNSRETGIIVLGNSGVGKSFICNLLIDEQIFDSEFRPEACTTLSSHHSFNRNRSNYTIWNVPGLIEVDQKSIDGNKEEINRAFLENSYAYVIFVWTEKSGRLQYDDIIAFNALNEAYRFPAQSVMFVFNNIPSDRNPEYDERLKFTLSKMLNTFDSAVKRMLFLEKINTEDKKHTWEQHYALWQFIKGHHADEQKRHGEIMLEVDQIAKLRMTLSDIEKKIDRERKMLESESKQKKTAFQNSLNNLQYDINTTEEKLAETKRTVEINKAALLRMNEAMETLKRRFDNYNHCIVKLQEEQLVEITQIKEKYDQKRRVLRESYENGLEVTMREAFKTEFVQLTDSDSPILDLNRGTYDPRTGRFSASSKDPNGTAQKPTRTFLSSAEGASPPANISGSSNWSVGCRFG